MKVWWVLTWDQYYPSGGLGNVDSTWVTKEEATARVTELQAAAEKDGWGLDYIEIKNVSDMLGLEIEGETV